MRRWIIQFVILTVFAVMLAACSDEAPADLAGCKGEGEDIAYDTDRGCHDGSLIVHYGKDKADDHSEEDAADHSEEEDADHSEEEDADHSEEEDADHSEEESTEDE